LIFLAALISVLVSVQPAQPKADPAASPAAKADDLTTRLDALDKKIAAIKDLSAEFEQQKKTALLKKPMTSSGTIKLKGAKTRWDTDKPHPTVMTIDSTEVRIYYPEQKTVEVYPVQGEMAKLASSPLPRIAVIREQFDIAEVKPTDLDPKAAGDLLAISLTPKADTLKEHVQRVRVLIDPSTACARSVEITDADGDQTTITFTNIKLDKGLTDKDVELTVPKDTTVSRPLEGGKPKTEGSK
jgi:outer membrane lipoprotein-sorting protein